MTLQKHPVYEFPIRVTLILSAIATHTILVIVSALPKLDISKAIPWSCQHKRDRSGSVFHVQPQQSW